MTDLERSHSRWRWTALSVYLLICFYDFFFLCRCGMDSIARTSQRL